MTRSTKQLLLRTIMVAMVGLSSSRFSEAKPLRVIPLRPPVPGQRIAEGTPGTMAFYPAPRAIRSGAAMIVCPGGGYRFVAASEGEPVAQWLNTIGIDAFVLRYHVLGDGARYPAPLLDGARAMRWVRAHAQHYDIDPHRLGMIGFSAGGHLASYIATHFEETRIRPADAIDRVSARPDLLILAYPVISMGATGHRGSRLNLLGPSPSPACINETSNELHVTPETPPAFLVHARHDMVAPYQNSVLFAAALTAAGVENELHIYDEGPDHGFAVRHTGTKVDEWMTLCAAWLRRHRFAR